MAKNPAAVALGRLGGLKGGKARAAALTPEVRSAIARKAREAQLRRAGKMTDAMALEILRSLPTGGRRPA